MTASSLPVRRPPLGLLLAAVVAGLLIAAAPARAGEGWWSGLDEGEAVSLADVMRGPEAYRDRTITFFAVFHTASGEFKYYPPGTLFTEARYVNLSAWPDGTPMWESEEEWADELPFLYLPRAHVQAAELAGLETFTRLEVTGRIRHVVRGQPAIEVFSFRPTSHRLGRDVLDNIKWGLNYAREGSRRSLQAAARRFKIALQPDLAPLYAMRVRKYLADTLRRLGLDEEAAQYENGEFVGTHELPDSMPPPDDQPAPFGEPPAGTPGGFPPPEGPLPSGFGSPDGGAPTAPEGLPEGFGEPAPPRGDPAGSPDGNAPDRAPRRASGIPPQRRPRLNGVR